MADTLTLNVKATCDWSLIEALDLANVVDASSVTYSDSLTDGTTAGLADVIWHDTRALAATTNDDLDLTALTQSIYGSTVTKTFAKVRGLLIINLSTTAGDDLEIGGSGGNEWNVPFGATGDKIEVRANGTLLLAAPEDGYAVTNSSADILRIRNPGANTINYKIVIWGTSA
jgi:hypothetical protein